MAVIALMMTLSASAQFYIYCKDGSVIEVDSISMIAPNNSSNKGFFEGTPEERGFYTPSEAIAAGEAGMIVKDDSIKVGGIISRWFKKSSKFDTYHSVSFFVMDPVTGQEHEFEFYNCYSLDKDSFATFEYTDALNAICVDYQGREFHLGDTVVGAGKYTIYNGTHELNTNCYLTEWHPVSSSIPSQGIGTFSVSATKQVTFSLGNLQYTQSTNTWSFASAQWEMLGTDNVTGGSVSSNPKYGDSKSGTALADKVDLFGWSTAATNFGVSTSTNDNDYSGSFVDWGTNKIGNDAPNTWRTLSRDEWDYLLNGRPNASSLCGVAQVNGVNGFIFLPDNWTCPAGVTFKSGFHSSDGVDYYAAYQTFTADQWSKLEESGAVFLPAAGYRNGTGVDCVQDLGYYWSATELNSYYTYCLYFDSEGAGMYDYRRLIGRSVRLVKDL